MATIRPCTIIMWTFVPWIESVRRRRRAMSCVALFLFALFYFSNSNSRRRFCCCCCFFSLVLLFGMLVKQHRLLFVNPDIDCVCERVCSSVAFDGLAVSMLLLKCSWKFSTRVFNSFVYVFYYLRANEKCFNFFLNININYYEFNSFFFSFSSSVLLVMFSFSSVASPLFIICSYFNCCY